MAEMITPEMITIAIASLAGLTFLLLLITIASLSRVKKRLLLLGAKSPNLEEKQRLLEAADKVASFGSRLDMLENVIAKNQNQLTRYGSKLNDHDTLFGQVSQIIGKNAANLPKALQRIDTLEEKIQNLKVFQNSVEKTRNLILDAFSATQTEILNEDTMITKRENLKEEALIPYREQLLDTEDFDMFSMLRDSKLHNNYK